MLPRCRRLLRWGGNPEQQLLDQDFHDDMVIIDTPVVLETGQSAAAEFTTTQTNVPGFCTTSINDLPTEILVRVFKFLCPVEDNLPQLGHVCRKWAEILRTGSGLWRTLHVDPMCYTWVEFSTLNTILTQYGSHVRTLTWRSNAPVYATIFAQCCQLQNLVRLKLPIKWTRDVIRNMSGLHQLQNVEIHGGFSLSDADLLQVAHQFPRLSHVSLSACWSITAEGVQNFLEQLPQINTLKLKVNSCLPLGDYRSEAAVVEGASIVSLAAGGQWACALRVLCLHYLPLQAAHLSAAMERLPNLNKLSISNCQQLSSVQIESKSLQKLYMFNLPSALFVSVSGCLLRLVRIDQGMESLEHVSVTAPRLSRLHVDGANTLRTIHIKSTRLQMVELYHCEAVDMRSVKDMLMENSTVVCLRIGRVSQENLTLDEICCPSLQELVLLSDFSCNALHVRSPTLRFLHTQTDRDLRELNHAYIVGNHLCKVSLVGVPALRSVVVQCVSVDAIELNLCSDDLLHLESCVVQAACSIGFLRLFKCHVNLLSVSTPLARTLALYRCNMTDYVLRMALTGCVSIDHLSVERCRQLRHLDVSHQPMKYLNLFGCSEMHRVLVESEHLIGVNLGCCPKVRLFIDSYEEDLKSPPSGSFQVVLPHQAIRWSHDYPPRPYVYPYR